MVELY